MSTYPMQPAPNHSHFFPPASSPASSTSHYPFPQYWYNNPSTSFPSPSSSPGKRKRDGAFDDQDSSSSDDGGPDYNNSSAHRGSHPSLNAPAQRATPPPPARPIKRPRREWNNSMDDATSGVSGTRPAGMENGFARMSLLNQQQAQSPTFVQEPIAVTQEPTTKEVHMKTRSWYEPEKDRIVVLDLDGSDTESESTSYSSYPSRSSTQSPVDEATAAANGYTISQAYLSRIKGVPQGPVPPPTMNSHRPGALVLYKVPPNFNADSFGVGDGEPLDDSHPNYVLPNWGPIPLQDDRPLYASIEEVDDDDDVEMMEVDGN